MPSKPNHIIWILFGASSSAVWTLPLSAFWYGPCTNLHDNEDPFFSSQNRCDFLRRQYFAAVDPLAHLLCKRDFDHTVGQGYENTYHEELKARFRQSIDFSNVFVAAM